MAAPKNILANRREIRRGSQHLMSIYKFFHSFAFAFSDLENNLEDWKASGVKCVCKEEGLGNP